MKVDHSKDCIFCKDLKERTLSYWVSTINNTIIDKVIDTNNVIVYESEHFCVIPDIAPLAIGHVLIVSKDHIISMTELSAALAMELKEVVNIVDTIISCNGQTNIIHFEHGPGKNKSQSLKSVDHFHLHCVPLNIDLPTLMKGYERFAYKKIAEYEDLVGLDIEDYIFCESFGEKYIYLLERQVIKSQLLRKVIFQSNKQNLRDIYIHNYDWKQDFSLMAYKKSKQFLDEAFEGNRK